MTYNGFEKKKKNNTSKSIKKKGNSPKTNFSKSYDHFVIIKTKKVQSFCQMYCFRTIKIDFTLLIMRIKYL